MTRIRNLTGCMPILVLLAIVSMTFCQMGLAADGTQAVYNNMKLTMEDLMKLQSDFDKTTAKMDVSMQTVSGIPYRIITYTSLNGCVLKEFYSQVANKLAMTEFKCCNDKAQVDKTTAKVEKSKQILDGVSYNVITYTDKNNCTLEEFYTVDTNTLVKSISQCCSCTLKLIFDTKGSSAAVSPTTDYYTAPNAAVATEPWIRAMLPGLLQSTVTCHDNRLDFNAQTGTWLLTDLNTGVQTTFNANIPVPAPAVTPLIGVSTEETTGGSIVQCRNTYASELDQHA